jgi:Flp pilus assembly protein TadD
MKDLDHAKEYEQRRQNMDPNNPTTHQLLGLTYRDMGKKEEAESELKMAAQLKNAQDSHP